MTPIANEMEGDKKQMQHKHKDMKHWLSPESNLALRINISSFCKNTSGSDYITQSDFHIDITHLRVGVLI